MDAGKLTIRVKNTFGSASYCSLTRHDTIPGVLELHALRETGPMVIRIGLEAGIESTVCLVDAQGVIQTVIVHPEATCSDGSVFKLPRPAGKIAIPEQISFDHPLTSKMWCHVQMFDDSPLR